MTDLRTEQLLQASFRGVIFSVRDEAQDSSGRKIVLHEYINSPDRFIEDLGQLSPTFTIEAFVSGNDWLSRSAELESALNEGGFSNLTLPTLGTFRVQALPYTKRASQRAVGEIVYSLEFATGRPTAGPAESLSDIEEVFILGDDARATVADKVTDTFNVPADAEGIDVFGSDLIISSDAILQSFIDIIPADTQATISSLVDNVFRGASIITQNLDEVGKLFVVFSSTEGIFQALSLGLTGRTFAQGEAAFTRLINATNFGTGNVTNFGTGSVFEIGRGSIFEIGESRGASDTITANGIPLWPATTQQRIDRNQNRVSISNLIQVNSLIVAYEVGANNDYSTRDEIINARELLEAAHEQVMRDATSDDSIVQSDQDVRFAVENLRITALDVMEQKSQQTVSTIIVKKRSPSSAFVESYFRYSDNFTESSALEIQSMELRNLNPDKSAAALDGDIVIFRN